MKTLPWLIDKVDYNKEGHKGKVKVNDVIVAVNGVRLVDESTGRFVAQLSQQTELKDVIKKGGVCKVTFRRNTDQCSEIPDQSFDLPPASSEIKENGQASELVSGIELLTAHSAYDDLRDVPYTPLKYAKLWIKCRDLICGETRLVALLQELRMQENLRAAYVYLLAYEKRLADPNLPDILSDGRNRETVREPASKKQKTSSNTKESLRNEFMLDYRNILEDYKIKGLSETVMMGAVREVMGNSAVTSCKTELTSEVKTL